jgi:hypothetical protein
MAHNSSISASSTPLKVSQWSQGEQKIGESHLKDLSIINRATSSTSIANKFSPTDMQARFNYHEAGSSESVPRSALPGPGSSLRNFKFKRPLK